MSPLSSEEKDDTNNKNKKKNNKKKTTNTVTDAGDGWWIDLMAGWISGAVSVLACQPLDTVVTRLQAAGVGGLPSLAPPAATAAAKVTGGELTAIVRAASTTPAVAITPLDTILQRCHYSSGGHSVRSLWAGSVSMIGAVPIQNALLMGGYGYGKRWSAAGGGVSSSSSSSSTTTAMLPIFVGGCVGGILQSFFMSPIEWIKVNQQTTLLLPATLPHPASTSTTTTTPPKTTTPARRIPSTRTLLQTFFRHKQALWHRGLSATLLRDGLPHGVWFVSYDYCKTHLLHCGPTESLDDDDDDDASSHFVWYSTVTVPLVSGAVAATTAWTVGYPFDIIKTRIQVTTTISSTTTTTSGSRSVYATGQQLIAEANGNVVRGLYRGFGWKLVRSIPASMIGFVTYEYIVNHLKNY